ncbi:uncharacterized protein LOC100837923 [Brachypodium distachyon]|uniref:RIN4 pathogenic type III effector avirulence factor Avr cleavage site domain-containing protein n=1 Tax=Brachypodium distachyon TaxID=15368 RepID=I1ILK1_BRADI|nr:uncharacterized protein LOC100837923 [Brachypodium distachyon]XP_024310717.1 uncharacterized protein LOC100837923 [Brachypodium distachyon]KQJ88446.1 hypothetical protein BRADI_4g18180v3 [Brachypodium distachyon]|eukprot:XP_003577536.1 uncharacterized protein LOC100837923 [Brachypodium distachyon]
MEGQGGHIPKFGDWKTTGGDTPYTLYFEDARKRKSMGSSTPSPKPVAARRNSIPPPKPASVRGNSIPSPKPASARGNSIPPPKPAAAASYRADANPPKPKERPSRSRRESSVGSVPTWGQWNENNAGGGAQQYTLVFEQIREERRSAPSTPNIEQRRQQGPTLERIKYHSHEPDVPKIFTCCGLFGK